MKNKAFTLIELMIVVAILGILAAIVLPQVQGHTMEAKESAALASLRMVRSQIEMYNMSHDDGPGYVSGNPVAMESFFVDQLTGISNASGAATSGTVPTATYPLGPYLSDIPANPFNGDSTVKVFTTTADFSTMADGSTGWLYKVLTAEFRLNTTATDDDGNAYYTY